MNHMYAPPQRSTTTTSKDHRISHQGYSHSSTSSKHRNVVVSKLLPGSQHRRFGLTTTRVILSFVVIVILLLATDTYSIRTGITQSIMTEQTPTAGTAAGSSKPFSLMVQLTFTELQYQQQFLKDITPLCQYIQEHESTTTIAYEILLSDQDPLRVLIVERYLDKENAFLQIHKTSSAFLEFRTKLQTMQKNQYVTVDGSSYYDSGIGYIHH